MIVDMKIVAVLAVTIWTIFNPVQAALNPCTTVANCAPATNVNCDDGAKCACNSDYKLNAAETDCEAKTFDDPCENDSDCANADSLAKCDKSLAAPVCKCLAPLYKDGNDACVAIIGNRACTGDSDTSCADDVTHATCDTQVCQCVAGYQKQTDDNTCGEVIGADCTDDASCDGGTPYACTGTTDKKCACKAGYMEKEDKTCVQIIDAECTDDASCGGDSTYACIGTDTKACACKGGYEQQADKTCLKVLTKTCTDNNDCDSASAQYACTGTDTKTCACATNYGVVGDECKMELTNIACTTDNVGTVCPPNSNCVSDKCKCKEGYTTSVNSCKKNGSAALVGNVGLLCGILLALRYVTGF